MSWSHFEELGKRDRVIHAVLNRLFKRRDIVINDDLYLRRWYVRGVGTDEQVFLHHIIRPDAGRELHDHPFDFTTRILSGGYYEQSMTIVPGKAATTQGQWYNAGDTATHSAEYTHRIVKVLDGTYTLVSAGRARRVWGFYDLRRDSAWTCALKWIPWREYLGTPNAPDCPEDVIH